MAEHPVIQQVSQTSSLDDNLAVAYYSPGWPLEACPNGIVTYVASMLQGMHDLGHQTYVLSGNVNDLPSSKTAAGKIIRLRPHQPKSLPARLLNAVLYRIPGQTPFFNHFTAAIHQDLKVLISQADGLDLFEMEESFGLARRVSQGLSIPVVVRLHGPWFLNGKVLQGEHQDHDFARRVRQEGKAIAEAFAISSPSQDVLEKTRQYYNLALEEAVVIPCPIASTPQDRRWRLEDADKNVIAFIGRFDRHKGGDLVIDAFAQVVREMPEARLIFAGPDRGYIDDKGYSWSIQEYIRTRLPGALETGQVEWLGQQPTSVLDKLRRRAQVTVIASRYDNFPYTALEALSAGCPIVGAKTGGIPEILTDGYSGLLFEGGEATDLAVKLLHILKNPNLAAQLGHQAGEECVRKFSLEVVAQQSVDFYRATLERWFRSRPASSRTSN